MSRMKSASVEVDLASVREAGCMYGWSEVESRNPSMVSFWKGEMRMNIWTRTGLVSTVMNHPVRGRTQMCRGNLKEEEIFELFSDDTKQVNDDPSTEKNPWKQQVVRDRIERLNSRLSSKNKFVPSFENVNGNEGSDTKANAEVGETEELEKREEEEEETRVLKDEGEDFWTVDSEGEDGLLMSEEEANPHIDETRGRDDDNNVTKDDDRWEKEEEVAGDGEKILAWGEGLEEEEELESNNSTTAEVVKEDLKDEEEGGHEVATSAEGDDNDYFCEDEENGERGMENMEGEEEQRVEEEDTETVVVGGGEGGGIEEDYGPQDLFSEWVVDSPFPRTFIDLNGIIKRKLRMSSWLWRMLKICRCGYCGFACKDQRALESHLQFVHKHGVFFCCGKLFQSQRSFYRHLALPRHYGEGPYVG